ncbi:hypothetical protein Tco_0662580 [Tanacetum coccineum]
MVNVIPPDHVDDVPVFELNQHDDVPIVPEPVLEDEDEDLKEEEFEEEEEPQEKEEEDDMEVDIEEDDNEPELTYPYEEVDPLNPPPPASDSEHDDAIEIENTIEHEDETVPDSVHEVGNEVRSSIEQGTAAMERMVKKLGNPEDKVKCKKLKKELEEARLSNTFLCMKNELVERDLYWTRFQAHEIMPLKSAPLAQAAIRRMIKESVNATIATEQARQANARNDARGSGPVRGQDAPPAIRECTFAGFMKCNPITFHGTEGAVELQRWFEKTESVFRISECAEDKKVKFAAATLQGPALT